MQSRLREQMQRADAESRFKEQIQRADSKSRFREQMQRAECKCRCRVQMQRTDAECRCREQMQRADAEQKNLLTMNVRVEVQSPFTHMRIHNVIMSFRSSANVLPFLSTRRTAARCT
jgi:hypothetical protein